MLKRPKRLLRLFLFEEAGDIGELAVSCGGEMCEEVWVGEYSGLREVAHAFSDFNNDDGARKLMSVAFECSCLMDLLAIPAA